MRKESRSPGMAVQGRSYALATPKLKKIYMREEAYIIHLGAEVPVSVRWEWDHGAWYDEGKMSPRRIEELMQKKKEVYVVSPTDGQKVRVRWCKPVLRRGAWRVMVEMQCARGNEVTGGVIVDEHAVIYDHITERLVSAPEIARGEGAFTDGVRLAARRCLSDMYVLELEERATVRVEGQMRMPLGKLAVSELPEEMRRAFNSYRLFTLQTSQTCPATPLHAPREHKCSLIGVMPLRAHESREDQKFNMSLYFSLRENVYERFRSKFATEAYLLPANKEWAPHGALAFRIWIRGEFHRPRYFVCSTHKLTLRLKEADFTPALYLMTVDKSEKRMWQQSVYFDPSAARLRDEDIWSLFKRPLRAIFTEAIHYGDIERMSMLRLAAEKPISHATPQKYRRVFTPDEIAAGTARIQRQKPENKGSLRLALTRREL